MGTFSYIATHNLLNIAKRGNSQCFFHPNISSIIKEKHKEENR